MQDHFGLSAHHRLMAGAAAAVLLAAAGPALAQTRAFDVAAQPAARGIPAFAKQAGVQILASGNVVGARRTNAVKGAFTVEEGLRRLLQDSGLAAGAPNAAGIIVVGGAPAAPQPLAAPGGAAEPAELSEVLVTGSRIRGAPPASPVTVVTAEDMRNAGQQDLGEVIRALPQNFAGGENPGSGARTAASSTSGFGNGASTLNLRGIGNDATLTLLNGHRLATNADQGMDIGAIPLLAVDRLEILADGASALYGSDAVGGVANIIVRPDRDRVSLSARYGAATDGGYDHTSYNALLERTWSGGGVLLAAARASNSNIAARQRSYTALMGGDNDLYPDQNRSNLFASARQELTPNVTVAIDALYNNLDSYRVLAFSAASFRTTGQTSRPTVRSFAVAPSVEIKFGSWLATAHATYGDDRTRTNALSYTNGLVTTNSRSCFCNKSDSLEAGAEGPLFQLGGGDARLAIGGGYRARRHSYNSFRQGAQSALPFSETENVKYAFGELSAPLVSDAQNIHLIDSLRATAALRYEDYPALGSVTTPKLGLVYGVVPTVSLRASWGKSFKAPTFSQRYAQSQILLTPVTGYGALFPTGSTFLRAAGGNPDLKPERATTYTLSGEWRPVSVPGLRMEVSYYSVDFRDRVITPFSVSAGVLTNPLYADLVLRNPTAAQQAAAIAASTTPLVNSTTAAYDPAKVVAIASSRYVNAAKQSVRGLDLAIFYRRTLRDGGSLTLTNASTYLDITQQRLANDVTLGVTGNFYQPRHFRSRSGVAWERDGLALATYLNYVGAARYRAVTPILDVKATTTVDVTARWAVPKVRQTVVGLSLINAFNSKPTVVPGLAYETSYDAAAYSATGRVASISLTKSW